MSHLFLMRNLRQNVTPQCSIQARVKSNAGIYHVMLQLKNKEMAIPEILSQHYNLFNILLSEMQPGWSALAYRVQVGSDLYFLKVYDKTLPTTHFAVERIDSYMYISMSCADGSKMYGWTYSV